MDKERKRDLYSLLFILGLVLMIWQIDVFRVTIISFWVPLLIIILSSSIAFIIDFKNYQRTFIVSGIYLYLYSAVFYIVGCGFILCSVFTIANYHLADDYTETKSYLIQEKSSLPGRRRHRDKRQLLVIIDYDNKPKEMVFNHYHYQNRNKYDTVLVDVREGFFGFDVFYDTSLK